MYTNMAMMMPSVDRMTHSQKCPLDSFFGSRGAPVGDAPG